MSAGLQIGIALGAVLGLLIVMGTIRKVATRRGTSAELQRKLMHVATGIFALALPWLFQDRWPVVFLIATTLMVMLALRLPGLSSALGATLHSVNRKSYGEFLFAFSVGLCFLLADGDPLLYILPIAVLTLADAAAALAGSTYGQNRFRVEDGMKSVEGSAVFFTITLLISIICFMYLSDLPPNNILLLSLMVAAFGTLVEAQSWEGFDNLFLPLGLLIFLAIHRESSFGVLIGLLALFVITLLGFGYLGKKVGLSQQATRVYTIAVFLLLAVTEAHNAMLPILVLAAHVWARAIIPGRSRHTDLDVVAALAIVSFGWLTLGNATLWNGVSFYEVTTMGMAMGLGSLALRKNLLAIAALAGLLFVLRYLLMQLNPAPSNWAEPLHGLSIAVLALTALVPYFAPNAFKRHRMLKLTCLAGVPALAYYGATLAGSWQFTMAPGGSL